MGMLSMSCWSSVVLPSSPSLRTFNTNLLTSMYGRLEEFHKSANTIEKECDRELKKSVNEAKEACTRTVKTSKYLAKKTKKEKFDEVQALKTERLQIEYSPSMTWREDNLPNC
ncbi:uncharacterized protein [Dysidea avara]|uniref:uncharacterized protein isoform X2 n=1 Tax=Dysidea avara TaxID=196820 RepID=UPI0033213880